MNNKCVEILLEYKKINIDEQNNVISNKAFRIKYVCNKEEYQKDVVEVNFIHSTEEYCDESNQV